MTKFRAQISVKLTHSSSGEERTFHEVIFSTLLLPNGEIEVAAGAPAHPKGDAIDTTWCKTIFSGRP
jgi:hypothetical protein